MDAPSTDRRPLVALAGNPNTGKTTLFNRLTGLRQKVGNYAGVTVERVAGECALPGGTKVQLLDVPGAYSLAARSREEELALQCVAGVAGEPRPDAIVLVLDATQLSRNLYLALQVLELGTPVVVALNMADQLAKRGERVDVAALERELGARVVLVSALHDRDFTSLLECVAEALAADGGRKGEGRQDGNDARAPRRALPRELEADLGQVARCVPESWSLGSNARARAFAEWALLSVEERDELEGVPPDLRARALATRQAATQGGRSTDDELIAARYAWIDERMPSFVVRASPSRTASERIDAVLLHPLLGFALFLGLMVVVFQALFAWSDPLIGLVEGAMGHVGDAARSILPAGLFADFVVEGVVAGVGSVVVFLPQILLLFFFIGLMEDTGYMARVAALMDRVMRAMGLSGRAFVPMLSGYACAVPAILATRTMERRRDRLLTMLVVPLMTCSARLPVYTLLIGALWPPVVVAGFVPVQGLLMAAMYLFSTLVALVAAAVLSRTLFRGQGAPLILELPAYRAPHWPSVLGMMGQRASSFLREAGGVILACTIALWFLLSFPKDEAAQARHAQTVVAAATLPEAEQASAVEAADARLASDSLASSWGGRFGHAIEPLIEPLGFDWKIGVGLVGAFAAREVFVSTMGVVYGIGGGVDEESDTLREAIKAEAHADGRPVYTPLVGLSLMVFFALACQCMSTLAAIKRETRSWGWPVFLFVYMTALAWVASFVVHQGGLLLGL
jgi:ferrous iron transport protein B